MAEQKSSWVKAKPEEIEKKVVELAKQNIPPEKIGLILRDQHGIPRVKIYGLKIKKILQKAGIEQNSQYENISKKIETLKKHSDKNFHDYKTKRSLVKNMAKLNKLKKFRK